MNRVKDSLTPPLEYLREFAESYPDILAPTVSFFAFCRDLDLAWHLGIIAHGLTDDDEVRYAQEVMDTVGGDWEGRYAATGDDLYVISREENFIPDGLRVSFKIFVSGNLAPRFDLTAGRK